MQTRHGRSEEDTGPGGERSKRAERRRHGPTALPRRRVARAALIPRTGPGFPAWNATLTAWATRVMRASARRRRAGRSDRRDVGRLRCSRPAERGLRARNDRRTPGHPARRPDTPSHLDLPGHPDTPSHPDPGGHPDPPRHPDTPRHRDLPRHPDLPRHLDTASHLDPPGHPHPKDRRPADAGIPGMPGPIRVPPPGRSPHEGASARHGTRRRPRLRPGRRPRPAAPGRTYGAARRAGWSMRFRVVSGSDLVTGRERVVRCGAWGRSGPRARLGGGRCGAFLRRRARRIPSTRQGSSRPGTLPPCAPPGRGAVQGRPPGQTWPQNRGTRCSPSAIRPPT